MSHFQAPRMIVGIVFLSSLASGTGPDTTSILKTIEVRWNLTPLGTRDAAANDLSNAFR
jgi:hypothetical protein